MWALVKDGTLYGWGDDRYGQVGDGMKTTRSLSRSPVPSTPGATGRDGELGDGSTTTTGRTTPGVVPGLIADAVAMGRDFASAIVPT